MTGPAVRPPVEAVHVVVPCHDEAALLPRCLAGLHGAVEALRRARPSVRTRVTVVLDRCSDGSAAVVAEHVSAFAGEGAVLESLPVRAGSAGASRRVGMEQVGPSVAALDSGAVWLASTDADSVVPPAWLVSQLALAAEGVEMVVGAVLPDPADLSSELLTAWRSRHHLGPGHPHVHGANLGLLRSAYLAVDGFPPVPVGEDVLLAEAVRRTGRRWCATAAHPVLTSGRLSSRVEEGFAGYLRQLDSSQLDPV